MQVPNWLKRLALILLLISSYSYIAYKLYVFDNWHSVTINSNQLILNISILLLLLVLNLFFEAKKWQTLLKPITLVKHGDALKMVFAGFTSGIVTPFKAGEPFGKIAFLDKPYRKDAIIMSYFGSLLQNITILLCGIIGLLSHSKLLNLGIQNKWVYTLIPITLLVIYILTKALSKSSRFKDFLFQIKQSITKLSVSNTLKAFGYGCLRYFTFCFQLYMCLYLFGCTDINFSQIFIYYLLITLFPSHLLVDMGIRGSVAIFVFSNNIFNPDILMAVFLVWIINQALPTLIGTATLVRRYYINIHKRTQSM
ncbi:hypothetical protein [Saccharicrinis aurantiacus]|uniref:hypothetical protein n=1 Tax=Saccharicrinis aurantiacus TaxID=1849719 RepID=UPI002491430B|nr:hypothetical protein [Saccharicrinis aurantiacus]